jgi:pimeloyl-ACP methyl ester carboxylesterase
MVHGFSDSLETWYDLGYVDVLQQERRLILVDARAHGRIDKAHHIAAYAEDLQVKDIVAVLRDLNIFRNDYFGYSVGERIGFAMAQYEPDQIRGMILGPVDG